VSAGATTARVVVRPGRWRLGCRVLGAVLVVVFALAAVGSVWASTPTAGQRLGGADRVSLAVLGLVLAGVLVLAGERPLVVADAAGLRIRNFFAQYDLPWDAVTGFTLVGRLPWAWLELSIGENRSVFAVQTIDGPKAAAALRDLRSLLAASQARPAGYGQGGTDHA
jgi:Bacterial PH domain